MELEPRPLRPIPSPGPGVFSASLLVAVALAAGAPTGLGAQEPADSAAGAPGLDLRVVQDTLENGLRVLALRRPGAPTASFVMRFEVGAADEVLGQTGIAHFLEHLLFKGTTTIGTTSLADELMLFGGMDAAQDSLLDIRAGRLDDDARVRLRRRIDLLEDSARQYVIANEWDRILTEHGARGLNATTDYDASTYFVQLPSNVAELWFLLEADRLANPVFREFYAERDVVAEERRSRVESTGGGRLLEEFYAAAYRVHPYGVPVIGHMSDILTHTREAVEAFHARYYTPDNAVIAVVGDIDPDRVLGWAERYFGPIPAGPEPKRITASEPPQRGERRIEVVFDAEPELLIGWHVPDAYHEDAPALTVLARVLAGGKTSRLYRRVVQDDPMTTSITAALGPAFRGPRLFTVAAQPLRGRSTEEIEAAVYEEIERLVAEPPSELELARVRNQIESSDVRRLASNLGLAFQLAESVAYHGDWRETFRSGEHLAAVTAADVQRVAREYLTAINRTVAELVPAASLSLGGEAR
jgi:predicted Zn-dependent peptidase